MKTKPKKASAKRASAKRADGDIFRPREKKRVPFEFVLDELAEIPSRVHVHHGTANVLARVVRVGERFAQLRLAEPIVAGRDDRVVLRADGVDRRLRAALGTDDDQDLDGGCRR